MMSEVIGLDPGKGAYKVASNGQSIELISQISVCQNPKIGRMFGLESSRLPLTISLPSGKSYFVGDNSHDISRPSEHYGMEIINGTEANKALFFGAFSKFIKKNGPINSPIKIICGLPLELLTGDSTTKNVLDVQHWMKDEHKWIADETEYHLIVDEVRITSQPAAALFDFVLGDDGKVIPERKFAYTKEIGILSIGMNTLEILVIRNRSLIQRFSTGVTSGVRRLLEMVNEQGLYSVGELDNLLRSGHLDVSQALPVWEREVMGQIEKNWGKNWRRFSAVVIVGGGAIHLQNALQYYFSGKAIFPDEPVLSIARGLWKLGIHMNLNKKS